MANMEMDVGNTVLNCACTEDTIGSTFTKDANYGMSFSVECVPFECCQSND